VIWLLEAWDAVLSFLDTGGPVLRVIFGVTFVMWVMLGERLWYLRWGKRRDLSAALAEWNARTDRSSWHAEQIRLRLVSRVRRQLNHSIDGIQTLVAVCPLLGILGTIFGMINVFHIMGLVGNSNPRAMAGGISQVTIPTMAGLVAALSGLFLRLHMARQAERETRLFSESLKSG
jgi:biopolymer transport protein ExbB